MEDGKDRETQAGREGWRDKEDSLQIQRTVLQPGPTP